MTRKKSSAKPKAAKPLAYLVTENGPAHWLHYEPGQSTGRLVVETETAVQSGDLFCARMEDGSKAVFRAVHVERLQREPQDCYLVDVQYEEYAPHLDEVLSQFN